MDDDDDGGGGRRDLTPPTPNSLYLNLPLAQRQPQEAKKRKASRAELGVLWRVNLIFWVAQRIGT